MLYIVPLQLAVMPRPGSTTYYILLASSSLYEFGIWFRRHQVGFWSKENSMFWHDHEAYT